LVKEPLVKQNPGGGGGGSHQESAWHFLKELMPPWGRRKSLLVKKKRAAASKGGACLKRESYLSRRWGGEGLIATIGGGKNTASLFKRKRGSI